MVKKACLTTLLLFIGITLKAQTDTVAKTSALKPDTIYEEPTEAEKKLVNGKVLFGFIVERDGSLSDIKILKGLSPELDKLAFEELKKMPKWQPATVNDKPIRKRSTFSMTFKGYIKDTPLK